MDHQSKNNFFRAVQNVTEPIRNNSEQPPLFSVGFRKASEYVPKRIEVHSEIRRNDSEETDTPQVSVLNGVRNVAKDIPEKAEVRSKDDLNRSEPVRNYSETNRTAPMCSAQHEGFSITVREVARIFEEAGAPRTERAITNWCNRNARGITRLACCYNEAERKYYVSPQSIEQVIKEERRKVQYSVYKEGGLLSEQAGELSEQVRKERNAEPKWKTLTGRARTTREETMHGDPVERHSREGETKRTEQQGKDTGAAEAMSEDERANLKELQIKNYELQVQLEGQKYLVRKFDDLVSGERERHEREKLALVDRLTDARHRIGSLEEKLLRLDAPKASVRDVETEKAAS